VRVRTDGILREVAKPPIQLAGRIAARLKVMASLDISERRKPQDGRIKMRLSKTKSIDFRVNTLPTLWGEKVVIRILDPSSAQIGIDALGYEPAQKDLYMAALKQPAGHDSGDRADRFGENRVAVHRPEYSQHRRHQHFHRRRPGEINMEGINQVNVNRNRVWILPGPCVRSRGRTRT
jgi:type IV pilus assembly protein PilB